MPGYTVLRYDHRGHGRSEILPGPWTIEDLADDAAQLIAAQLEGPVHFVGLSMGGMVAQQVAVRHPQHVASIVVAGSCQHYDDAARALWKARIETVRTQGMAAIAGRRHAALVHAGVPRRRGWRQARAGAARRAGGDRRAGLCGLLRSGVAHRLSPFQRTDCLSGPGDRGTRDESTPLEMSQAICRSISGAQLATLDAAHLSAVEQPARFAGIVAAFIASL